MHCILLTRARVGSSRSAVSHAMHSCAFTTPCARAHPQVSTHRALVVHTPPRDSPSDSPSRRNRSASPLAPRDRFPPGGRGRGQGGAWATTPGPSEAWQPLSQASLPPSLHSGAFGSPGTRSSGRAGVGSVAGPTLSPRSVALPFSLGESVRSRADGPPATASTPAPAPTPPSSVGAPAVSDRGVGQRVRSGAVEVEGVVDSPLAHRDAWARQVHAVGSHIAAIADKFSRSIDAQIAAEASLTRAQGDTKPREVRVLFVCAAPVIRVSVCMCWLVRVRSRRCW